MTRRFRSRGPLPAIGPRMVAVLAAAVAGCDGPQSMLDPAGPAAATMETVWWVLFWICVAVFVLVMAVLAVAIYQRRGAGRPLPSGEAVAERDAGAERRRVVWVLVAGAAIPAVILAGIFVYTMVVLDELRATEGQGAVTVIVTGKQYWWDVRYPLPSGDTVVTANEIHIPAGQPVELLLRSDDVIHSLWIPRLHGKTDMIPGRTNRMWLRADETGIYRGQCAEYCGQQHTWMALYVVAEPEEEFRGWLSRQRRPAAPVAPGPDPAGEGMDQPPPPGIPDSVRAAGLARNARIRRGREVFLDLEHRCVNCHVIRGETEPRGAALGPEEAPGERPGRTAEGPDLTHVASRISIAAGMLATNRGNMGGWISNPQVLKPGNLMPRIPLEPEEMNALLEYLMSLQ